METSGPIDERAPPGFDGQSPRARIPPTALAIFAQSVDLGRGLEPACQRGNRRANLFDPLLDVGPLEPASIDGPAALAHVFALSEPAWSRTNVTVVEVAVRERHPDSRCLAGHQPQDRNDSQERNDGSHFRFLSIRSVNWVPLVRTTRMESGAAPPRTTATYEHSPGSHLSGMRSAFHNVSAGGAIRKRTRPACARSPSSPITVSW